MTVATFQPVFTQAFPRHDRYTGLVAASDYTVQWYILEWQAFAPTTNRDALGYDIALPLTEVPVFKFTHVDLASVTTLDSCQLVTDIMGDMFIHLRFALERFFVKVPNGIGSFDRRGLVVAICRCFPVTPEPNATGRG